MNHSFEIAIAQDFDVDTAIFLNNMAFWITRNVANKKNYHEGTYWCFNSIPAFIQIFPYWSHETIKRIIRNAIRDGLLIKNNFNKRKYDNTNWYALTPKALSYYPILAAQILNTPVGSNRTQVETNRPIPDNKQDILDSSEQSSALVASDQGLTPVELIDIFSQEMPCSTQPIVNAKTGAIGDDDKRAIRELKEHFLAKNKEPLTKDYFRRYLKYLKKDCPGFINNEYQRSDGYVMKNGFIQIVNWQNYEKAMKNILF